MLELSCIFFNIVYQRKSEVRRIFRRILWNSLINGDTCWLCGKNVNHTYPPAEKHWGKCWKLSADVTIFTNIFSHKCIGGYKENRFFILKWMLVNVPNIIISFAQAIQVSKSEGKKGAAITVRDWNCQCQEAWRFSRCWPPQTFREDNTKTVDTRKRKRKWAELVSRVTRTFSLFYQATGELLLFRDRRMESATGVGLR